MKKKLSIPIGCQKRTMFLAKPDSRIYVQLPECQIEVEIEQVGNERRAFCAHLGEYEVELCGGEHSRGSRIIGSNDEKLTSRILEHFYNTATNAKSPLGRWLKSLEIKVR